MVRTGPCRRWRRRSRPEWPSRLVPLHDLSCAHHSASPGAVRHRRPGADGRAAGAALPAWPGLRSMRSVSGGGEGPMTLTHDRRAELLGGCPLFQGVDAEHLAAVGDKATEIEFAAGRVIARQGEIGTGF